MYKFESNDAEFYDGPLQISLAQIPAVRLRSIELPPNAGPLQKFTVATQKRQFTLAEDWKISIDGIDCPGDLNGVITIPARGPGGKEHRFDGASVPLPWLISFLSIGALRPLGVMLIPSLVHDYAFMYGELLVAPTPEEEAQPVPLQRHEADNLFYGMIRTFNGDPITAWLAYLAVRLGWILRVKYNGRLRGGRFPIRTGLIGLGMITALVLAGLFLPGDPADRFAMMGIFFVVVYLGIYSLTVLTIFLSKK